MIFILSHQYSERLFYIIVGVGEGVDITVIRMNGVVIDFGDVGVRMPERLWVGIK
jgi:hypothetical protein